MGIATMLRVHLLRQWLEPSDPAMEEAVHDVPRDPRGAIVNGIERLKAGVRTQVEYTPRVIKRQFGFTEVRPRSLAKGTVQLMTLFALSNLWMARGKLIAMTP